MTNLLRVKVGSAGYIGGPGVNVWHFSPGVPETEWTVDTINEVYDALGDIYEYFATLTPNTVTYTRELDAAEIDVASGDIVNMVTPTSTFSPIPGTNGTGTAPRSLCMTVAYGTDIFHAGRRLRGRSFLGPMSPSAITSTGQVSATEIDEVQDRYAAIITGIGVRLAVYSRPKLIPVLTGPDEHTTGFYGDVVTVRANSKPGNLRSRRD